MAYRRNKRMTVQYLVIMCRGQWCGTAARRLLKHSGPEFELSFF